MRTTLFCFYALLTLALLTPSTQAAESAIQLQLVQLTDQNCDGIAETAIDVPPSGCIIYQLQAINTGTIPYYNVNLSAHIPAQTDLAHPYRLVGNEAAPINNQIQTGLDKEQLITTRINTLYPGAENQLHLQYAVKVR